ncbi:MAG: DNA repair protein RecN [Oscillospiraceae bacterium]|nr:DNA repair protein RecN [Oscillospiraceae bacterium]
MRIKLLHIENIAVIEKADIEFAPGLNVLTGETGAGKSIVIDALTAVTGARVSREIIRTGADKAAVTAEFSADDEALPWFADNDIDLEDGEIIITRKVTADGKSTCRVNGMPVSAAQLRELGAELIDIHGQNDGRKLLDESSHLTYLDAFGDLSVALNAFKAAYKKMRDKQADIEKFSMDADEKTRRIDALKYQIDEIEHAKLKPGEQDELTARRDLMRNASKLTEAVETAFESLYGGDNGAVAQISTAQAALDRAAGYSEALQSLGERLTDARYTVQDISDSLRDLRAELDFSPDAFDALEDRLDVLRRITRKYGSEQDALDRLAQSHTELADIEDSSDRLEKLSNELDACVKEAVAFAEALSIERRAAAETLEKRVMSELAELNMPGVEFKAEFTAVAGEHGLSASGGDDVRFLMSANVGQAPGRISRIASGGELSRIMLALKNVLSAKGDTGTMVFDEVDAGVSGIAAQRVGEKLAKLAQNRQVLCVTHLPQIAAMADMHFEIQKSVTDGETFTHVIALDLEGRKQEIARLSGGENITASALTSAEEQLASAEGYKQVLRD